MQIPNQNVPRSAADESPTGDSAADDLDLADMFPGETFCSVKWDETHFFEVSKPLRDLGFAVIPSNGPTVKTPLEGDPWKQWCGEGRQSVPEELWRKWCRVYHDHEGLLLLDSSTMGRPDLVVVDADHPSVFSWVEQQFGATPLTVESGREEGGRHYYYVVPPGEVVTSRNGMIGPPESFTWVTNSEGKGRWKGKIDVKSHRAYVVAPGARHKSGRIYTASMPFAGIFDAR